MSFYYLFTVTYYYWHFRKPFFDKLIKFLLIDNKKKNKNCFLFFILFFVSTKLVLLFLKVVCANVRKNLILEGSFKLRKSSLHYFFRFLRQDHNSLASTTLYQGCFVCLFKNLRYVIPTVDLHRNVSNQNFRDPAKVCFLLHVLSSEVQCP